MKPEEFPDHLRHWWFNQYEAVQEFGQVLLHEDAASPQLMGFFEKLAATYPKMRSVRMTNALHNLWRNTPNELAFELALRHCKSPTAIQEFHRQLLNVLHKNNNETGFSERFTADSPFADVMAWLEAQSS